MNQQTENPSALAGATGADRETKAASLRPDNSTNAAGNATELYHDAAINIRTMCRAASPRWRVAIAWGAMTELDPADAAVVAGHFMPNDDAGPPIPAFTSAMQEAGFWAGQASPAEHAAYALACFNMMAPARQSAFLGHVQRRAAA